MSSSSSDDDVYFQSVWFFFDLNAFYLTGIAFVHLTHWIINLAIEFKHTKSCGTESRNEGILGYILLVFSFCIPFSYIMWITFGDIPGWSILEFGTGDYCCTFWIAIAWFGTILSIIDLIAFAYVHYSLGLNWSGTITVKKEHKLVTSGPYKFARHPMYAVLLVVPLIVFLQTSDWIYSLTWILAFIYPVSRCRKEERLMQEVFGDEYRDYMDKVGPFFPFTIPMWGNKIDNAYALVTEEDFYDNSLEV